MITGTVRYGSFFSFATSLFLIVNKICKTPYKLSNELRTYSVVEPFHFGPAPASQDGGSGPSSSSSPVVRNLLLKKKVFTNFTSQFTGYECFALLFQHFI